MKNLEIKKGSPKFLRGFDSAEQLILWLEANSNLKGVSFVGRSNVGKSSLINSLFGNKTAKTSKTPGRTQQINVFSFKLNTAHEEDFYLFDLPGYGHAKVNKAMSKNWMDLMNAFFMHLNDTTLLVNVQDARHPNQAADQQFYRYIDTREVEVYLAFNKIDKLKRQKERAALDKIKPALYEEYKTVKQMFFVSAEKRTKVDTLEQSIINYLLRETNPS